MPTKPTTPEQFVAEYERLGSVKAVARHHDFKWGEARRLYLAAVEEGLMDLLPVGRKTREQNKATEPKLDGKVYARQSVDLEQPGPGEVRRWIFTCAQNNTRVHPGLWRNLLAFAKLVGADIRISRFTYIKSGLGALGDKARWLRKEDSIGRGVTELWWDKEIEPYLLDERATVAPGLVFCGELNILPTAARPLSGLLGYSGASSAIFPHVKAALESVPAQKGESAKLCFTTGAVTLRNYIQRKAGLKGEFHHVFGALLVEVDADGAWWCRQLNADADGTFHDLNLVVRDGQVEAGTVEAVVWGDVHVADLDREVASGCWADGGLLDALRPCFQVFHDVLDFRSRSHHEVKDPHRMFLKHVSGVENVRAEVDAVARFLCASSREWCQSVVVDSNHHHHLGRWLRDEDGRRDPLNAEFWLECQRRAYEDIRSGKLPHYLRIALNAVGYVPLKVRLLEPDESFVVCPDAGGGVECGQHGHNGPGGARGTTQNLLRTGRKMCKGHDHQATICDGVYSVGTCSSLAPYWTAGPSTWSHSHCLIYPNGKRAIVTMRGRRWAAGLY